MVKTYLDKVDVRIGQLMSKLSRKHDHDDEEEVGNRYLRHVKAEILLTKYPVPGFCKEWRVPVVYLPCYLLLRIRRKLERTGHNLYVRGILSLGKLIEKPVDHEVDIPA